MLIDGIYSFNGLIGTSFFYPGEGALLDGGGCERRVFRKMPERGDSGKHMVLRIKAASVG